MADLQPTPPTWYPSPGDVVTFQDASIIPPIGRIGQIMSVETVTTGKPMAWIDAYKLSARQISIDRLAVVTNPAIIAAYHRTTEAIKELEAMLRD